MDDIVNYTAQMTADAVIQELKKQRMLKLEPTAFERTRDDVKGFKVGLSMLSDEQVPIEFKKQIAVQMVEIQGAIKKVQNYVDKKDYVMFYEYNMQNENLRSIATKHGIDEGTVKRALTRCIDKLSVFLHPDAFISEILY